MLLNYRSFELFFEDTINLNNSVVESDFVSLLSRI